MRILPVLDLLGRQVVRGIAGQRAHYRPVESSLAADSAPETVAKALVGQLGFRHAYVADLDAIAGKPPDWQTYQRLIGAGLTLWVDAGVGTSTQAREMVEWTADGTRLERIIVGLESVESLDQARHVLDLVGPERFVFSLDLHHGQPLTRFAEWQARSPLEVAELGLKWGVRRWIVLDLAAIGRGEGLVTLALCRWLRDANPQAEIISGGGVRGAEDLEALEQAGCDWALVASALHDGRLSAADLAHWR